MNKPGRTKTHPPRLHVHDGKQQFICFQCRANNCGRCRSTKCSCKHPTAK